MDSTEAFVLRNASLAAALGAEPSTALWARVYTFWRDGQRLCVILEAWAPATLAMAAATVEAGELAAQHAAR